MDGLNADDLLAEIESSEPVEANEWFDKVSLDTTLMRKGADGHQPTHPQHDPRTAWCLKHFRLKHCSGMVPAEESAAMG